MNRRRKGNGLRGRWMSIIRLVGGGLVLCAALLYVWQHVAVGSVAREVKALARQKQRLDSRHDRLASEIAYLSRGERITKMASSKIDLILPTSFAVTLYAVPPAHRGGEPEMERKLAAWRDWLSRPGRFIQREAEASTR